MKKIISLLIAVNMIFAGVVYAEEAIDYSAQLAELEELLSKCERLKIPTDYERVNYSVIKRFESLLNEDIADGHPAVEQNIAYMDDLYEEAKENLLGYISGAEKPDKIEKPDMMNTSVSGSLIRSDGQPIFSIGYGHFNMARADLDYFPDFGLTNIQMEIGPKHMAVNFYGWNEQIAGGADASVEREYINSDYVMHLINNTPRTNHVFMRLYRTVPCTPGTTYKFGCRARGSAVDNIWVSLNDFNDISYLTGSSYWKEQSFYYTAGENQTKLTFSICANGITDAYLDNFFVYEVDSSDTVVGENLVANPGLDGADRYVSAAKFITDALVSAEKNNTAVSLLISPHYFPTNLDAEIYTDNGGFISFNVNHPKAREVIENYLRTLIPLVVGYKSLDNICLSNEPTFNTMNFYDFYNPLFREYLKEVHGSIETLNEKYNSDYTDFNEINMPTDLKDYDAICYDWIEFNDRTFADWHKWMAGIIREYLPDIPLHSKVMGYFAFGKDDAERTHLMRGTDFEYFNEFSDYAGNDTWDYMNDMNRYHNTMFLYDYQMSVTKKPVYNSEDHNIQNGSEDFTPNQRKHFRNNLLMGAVHGRSMSSVWVWDKGEDSLYNSIAYRPDVAAEAGKTSLDLMRYNSEFARLQQEKPKTAVFYSKPSRLYDANYSQKLLWTYMALVNMGEKVGIVSDNSIDLLYGYDVLVIPGATNCKAETLEVIRKFADRGGKIVYTGNVLRADEYNNPLDSSFIEDVGFSYTSYSSYFVNSGLYDAMKNAGRCKLYFMDADTGRRAENLDWQYSVKNDSIMLIVTNLKYNNTKNLVLYMDDKPVTNIRDCFTGEQGIETVSVDGYTPRLMSISIPKPLTLEIDNISVDREEKIISWDYRTDKYFGTNIYSVSDRGTLNFIETVETNKFSYSLPGTYLVRALGVNMKETEGRLVTVTDEMTLTVNCEEYKISDDTVFAKVQVENNTDKLNVGVVFVKAYDAEGKVVGYSSFKLNLFPYKTDTFKVNVPTDSTASKIEIYAEDSSSSGNIISEILKYEN